VRDRQASANAFLANLRQPMPLGRKLRLLLRNRLRFPPRPCCGHPGEPGCWEPATGPGPGHDHSGWHQPHRAL